MAWLVSRFDPRISIAASLLLGIILSLYIGLSLDTVAGAWLILAALLVLCRRRRALRTWGLLMLAITTGLFSRGGTASQHATADRIPLREAHLVEGTITSIRAHRITLCNRTTCIQVVLPKEHPSDLHVSDLLLVHGRIRPPLPPRNPHDLDERQLARTLGVNYFLEDPLWMRIQHPEDRFLHRLARARNRVTQRIQRRMANAGSAAILAALLTGNRSAIDEETRGQFSDSGLSHVLAVSGLHIGLLAFIMLALARSLMRRFRMHENLRRALSGGLSIFGITFLALWMGATPSVSRAALMGVVLFGAFARRQPYSPWTAWWWALVAGLITAPDAWRAAGFSLSFAAVAAILLFLPTLSRLRTRPIPASILVSVAATLGTAPLLAHHMGHVPVAGALLSPFVVPLMPPILVFGALMLVDPGPLSVWIADLLVTLLRHAALWGSNWPEWTRLSGIHIMIWPWLLLVIFAPADRRKRVRRTIIALTMACAAVITWPVPAALHYTQLDVGQGDATVLVFSSRYSVVIDTGASEYAGRAIERHLRAHGAQKIDLLIHSHPHADHTGGSRYLASVMPISRYVDNANLGRGDSLVLGRYGRLYALHPPKKNQLSKNEASLVLRLQAGSTSFLFMGDAEQAAEYATAQAFGPLLDVDVVKVGHHGSRSSSTLPLVVRTTPHTAVVSAGRNNRFSHPHEEVIALWRAHADSVHVTARHGAFVHAVPPHQ
ncbi:MAG: DNA internalization-related competence protein ComEC/Rec2 [Bacteroidetes bacterium CG12_big_fil_rev_8_21_14_0_65_60_17]|nr:MAG: DNA internalization-related competence protein ComEC/Rec2 [Bacteroidetes bacterium CG12_big_fil_rev_8_21_14_0_65_60_17]